MKATLLLLVSAVSLLAVAAAPSPAQHKATMKRHEVKTGNQNLKRIIDLAEKYNESLTREFFVDDVGPLVDAGCGPKFFCKVHDILHHRRSHFEELVRNLDVYQRDVNCTVLLADVTSTGVSIQLPELMKHLITCIRQTNYKGSNLGIPPNP